MTIATNMVTSLYAECGQPFQMTVVTRPQHKFARRLFALTWGFERNRDFATVTIQDVTYVTDMTPY
jgi:hypothetical protein